MSPCLRLGGYPYECAQGLDCGYDEVTLNEACVPTLPAGTPCFDDEACGVGFECEDPPEGGGRVCLALEALVCIGDARGRGPSLARETAAGRPPAGIEAEIVAHGDSGERAGGWCRRR